MKKYIIERNLQGVGDMNTKELGAAAAQSNRALEELAPIVQWQHSYVTENKTFCIYLAKDAAAIKRHAELSGFPANIITEVQDIIDPTTANSG